MCMHSYVDTQGVNSFVLWMLAFHLWHHACCTLPRWYDWTLELLNELMKFHKQKTNSFCLFVQHKCAMCPVWCWSPHHFYQRWFQLCSIWTQSCLDSNQQTTIIFWTAVQQFSCMSEFVGVQEHTPPSPSLTSMPKCPHLLPWRLILKSSLVYLRHKWCLADGFQFINHVSKTASHVPFTQGESNSCTKLSLPAVRTRFQGHKHISIDKNTDEMWYKLTIPHPLRIYELSHPNNVQAHVHAEAWSWN